MKRTMTSWLAALAFLLMLAAPAQADDTSEEENTDEPANAHGKETSEAARNKTNEATGAVIEEVCRLVHVQWNNPALIFDPLLNMVDFDPDECYEIVVSGPLYTWSYRYEPTE